MNEGWSDQAKKGLALTFAMFGMMFCLIGLGMIFGVVMAAEPFQSTAGRVSSVILALGAVNLIVSGLVAPRGKHRG